MKNWLREQIRAEVKQAMPFISFPAIQLLDMTVQELISSSESLALGMKAVADRTKSAAIFGTMDLSVEAEAFGSKISFSDDEVPTVIGAIIDSMADAKNLKIPPVGSKRTGRYLEAIGIASQTIRDRPVFASAIGPFSLTGRLLDVSEALIRCITEPLLVHEVLEKATSFLIEYIKAYRDQGANGVVIAEPLAGILSPKLAAEFSEPYVRRIADETKNDHFLVIYHNCGDNTVHMIDSILATGCDGYHFGNSVDMGDVLSQIPDHILVMGNINPAAQFLNGTVSSIYEETYALLEACSPQYPNFIISSGCDLPPLSSWDNIDAFFRAVDDFYDRG